MAGLQRWDSVVKMPAADYSAPHQDRDFLELIRERKSYVGAIVVPIEPAARQGVLRRFPNEFGRPVVFIDVAPFEHAAAYPQQSCFVGFDGRAGGGLAADAMVRAFRARDETQARVLVLTSSVQSDRQGGFKDRLQALLPGASVTVDEGGRFLREEASRLARHHFDGARRNRTPLSGVFCTNDEMALGVLDALPVLPQAHREMLVVVGFDGIQEARLLIERGDRNLVNTVVQDVERLAATAVERLDALSRRQEAEKVTLLEPRLFRAPQ